MIDWRRAAATAAVAVLVAAACATAGVWQWHRHQARSAAVAVVERTFDAPVVPLTGAMVSAVGSWEWQRVAVTARYLPGTEVLLRNRPVDGRWGFHVLAAAMVLDGDLTGEVLVVDRGWLAAGEAAAVVPAIPPAPSGPVRLVVRLRPVEPPTDRSAPAGQVQAIAPDQVRAAAARPWTAQPVAAYGQLVTEDGEPPANLGPLARPRTDLGPHLSYAFQWWVFATGALVGGVVLVVRDARDRPRSRRVGAAEAEEDALLDAQEAARG